MRRARHPLHALAWVGILSAAVTLATVSGADTPLDQARALAGQATVEYNVGHFDQALDLYTKAYEALPKPALLFDIGQCHRMLGHYERAVFFFEGYLREQPEATNREVAEGLLAESKQQLEAQRAAAERAAQQHDATASAAQPAPSPPPVAAGDANPRAVVHPSTGHPAVRIAGVATAGVGIALLATALVVGLHASSLSNDISQVSSQHGTWTPQDQADYDSGKSAATAATILYVVGGVALATGGVLTFLGWPRTAPDARPAAAVAPMPGGASLVVAGRF
jgi:hypothetical protein